MKQQNKIVALYCRLSRDDGYSGTNYDRPDFRHLENDILSVKVSTVPAEKNSVSALTFL